MFRRGKRFAVQNLDDVVRRGTIAGFLGQAAGQQILRRTFRQRTQIGFLVDDAVQNIGCGSLSERRHAPGRIHHDPGEGEDIAFGGLRLTQDRFRRGIGRGPEGLTGLGEDGASDGTGDPEVDDLGSSR